MSSDNSPIGAKWDLDDQRSAILRWFADSEARGWCARCCRKFGVPDDMVGDVWSSAYIRVASALARRNEPFDDLQDTGSAARYAARACENATIDLARSTRRRTERSTLSDELAEVPEAESSVDLQVGRLILEDVRRNVVVLARGGRRCAGCPVEVVLAAALHVVNAHIVGDSGNLSDMMYEALEAVDADFPGGRSEAARQRKRRCGHCVTELMRDAISMTDGAS